MGSPPPIGHRRSRNEGEARELRRHGRFGANASARVPHHGILFSLYPLCAEADDPGMGHRVAWSAAVVCGALFCSCSGPGARLHVGYIQTEVSGELALESSIPGATLDRIDTESSLGLTEASPSVLIRGEADAGPIRATASFFQYSESGEGTISGSFGGIGDPISASTPVSSELDFTAIKAAVTFDVLDLDVFRLSPGLGVDLFDMQASVTEQMTGETEDIDEMLPIPMVFLQAEAEIGPVGAVVDAGLMDIGYDDFNGTFIDLEALVYYQPITPVELFAGYRWISIDADGLVDEEAFIADLVIQGWFVGGGVSF
jgi:hypothetical protein